MKKIIDLNALLNEELPEPDFVFSGLMAGTVGALTAAGGTGKSFLSLQIALTLCQYFEDDDFEKSDFYDPFGLAPKKGGAVLYLGAEDPEPILKIRIKEILNTMTDEQLNTFRVCNCRLHFCPLLGRGTNLMDPVVTNWIKKESDSMAVDGEKGYRLIIIDTFSRFHDLDENNNGEMSRVLKQMENIAAYTGAAVLFLHHSSKGAVLSGQGKKQQSARGASSLIDNARWQAVMQTMTEQEAKTNKIEEDERKRYVSFLVEKSNYGPSSPEVWLKRSDKGVLEPTAFAGKNVVAKKAGTAKKRKDRYNHD